MRRWPLLQRPANSDTRWLFLILLVLLGILVGRYWESRFAAQVAVDSRRRAARRRGTRQPGRGRAMPIELFRDASPLGRLHRHGYRAAESYLFAQSHADPARHGLGFIWDNEGHVITNSHVIQEARYAKVVWPTIPYGTPSSSEPSPR